MADLHFKQPAPDRTASSLQDTLVALTALAPEAGALDPDPALFGRALARRLSAWLVIPKR